MKEGFNGLEVQLMSNIKAELRAELSRLIPENSDFLFYRHNFSSTDQIRVDTDLVKKAADDNASNIHILKNWVSDMSEYIGTCKDETIGKVTEQTNLSKKSCLVIGNIDRQLETIKTLVVTSLQVCFGFSFIQ